MDRAPGVRVLIVQDQLLSGGTPASGLAKETGSPSSGPRRGGGASANGRSRPVVCLRVRVMSARRWPQARVGSKRTIEIVQFPLTFCVLPALLIVFLGPPLLSLIG